MIDFQDALVAELFSAAMEYDGFLTLYLTDGTTFSARPLAVNETGRRLILLLPDGKCRGLNIARLDGVSPDGAQWLRAPSDGINPINF